MEKHNKSMLWARILFILLTIGLLFALSILVGKPLLQFVKEPEQFRQWVQSHGIWSPLAYIGIVVCQVLIAFIPGEPFEIVAGYAFGAVPGTLLCLLGTTLGSLLVFFFVRKWGVKLVTVFFPLEKLNSLQFLQNSKKRDLLFLIIYMIPGTPKDLLSYFAGLTNIQFVPWLLICLLGRMPSVITSTVGGDLLGAQNYPAAVLVFFGTMLLSAAGIWIYNKICEAHQTNQD